MYIYIAHADYTEWNSLLFMIMAGMEKKELSIQLIRGVLSFVLALVHH